MGKAVEKGVPGDSAHHLLESRCVCLQARLPEGDSLLYYAPASVGGETFHEAHSPGVLANAYGADIAEELGETDLVRPGSIADAPARVPRPTRMNLLNSHADHPAMRLLPRTEDTLRKLAGKAE